MASFVILIIYLIVSLYPHYFKPKDLRKEENKEKLNRGGQIFMASFFALLILGILISPTFYTITYTTLEEPEDHRDVDIEVIEKDRFIPIPFGRPFRISAYSKNFSKAYITTEHGKKINSFSISEISYSEKITIKNTYFKSNHLRMVLQNEKSGETKIVKIPIVEKQKKKHHGILFRYFI